METAILCLCVLISIASSAWGGINNNGGMIVHTNDLYSYTVDTRCTTLYVQNLGSCFDATTRTDLEESVLWLLAVFNPAGNPRVGALCNLVSCDPDLDVEEYWRCAPAGSYEIPDGDWPNSGTHTNIAFGQTIAWDYAFPFYGFLVSTRRRNRSR